MTTPNRNYSQILEKIQNTPWVISPEGLSTIMAIVSHKLDGNDVPEEYAFGPSPNRENTEEEDNPYPGIGVLNISGSIFPKANMMTRMSGATSIESLQKDFRSMLADASIKSILMDIDSPGGMADLVQEFGEEIYEARGQKPIVAIANTGAQSAAYWLGSQADSFYVTPSGQVGSIGVYTVHQDVSAMQEKAGISTTFISAGKYKVEGNPFAPLTDEAKQHLQNRVDDTYEGFVNAVARGRGVTPDVVKEAYGNGRTYHAQTALAMGMVDGVESFDSVVKGMSDQGMSSNFGIPIGSSYSTGTTGVADNAFSINFTDVKEGKVEVLTHEALAALGLSEEATNEEINAAVIQLATEIAPIRDAVQNELAFAEQFPEQAALLDKLKADTTNQAAKLFSESYAQFSTDSRHGFSGVAVNMVEDLHKKISDRSFTHDDFKEFLDLVGSGSAIVDYTERGTTREQEITDADTPREAAKELKQLAFKAIEEAGGREKLSFGDALAKVATENPELAKLYRESLSRGGSN